MRVLPWLATLVVAQTEFPCTKLAEILPDTALQFAKEYFAWKNPDKINVSLCEKLFSKRKP